MKKYIISSVLCMGTLLYRNQAIFYFVCLLYRHLSGNLFNPFLCHIISNYFLQQKFCWLNDYFSVLNNVNLWGQSDINNQYLKSKIVRCSIFLVLRYEKCYSKIINELWQTNFNSSVNIVQQLWCALHAWQLALRIDCERSWKYSHQLSRFSYW